MELLLVHTTCKLESKKHISALSGIVVVHSKGSGVVKNLMLLAQVRRVRLGIEGVINGDEMEQRDCVV